MSSTAERTISRSSPLIPRLRLRPARPPGSPATLLDGGWQPRSADPAAELPGLILALDDTHGPITGLMLGNPGWDTHPRRLDIAGRVIRLGWFDTMPAGLLTAICANGQRTDLLIVPPGTHETAAYTAMATAADPANSVRTPQILAAIARIQARENQAEVALENEAALPRWESEGGRLPISGMSVPRRTTAV